MRGNVLVVEDDADCGQMIIQMLGDRGFGVRLVKSRDDALEAMRRYLYDYILLDYAMPGLSIEDFVAICVEKGSNLILISAVVDPQVEAQRLGVKSWLRKPFTPEALLRLMNGLGSNLHNAVET